MLGRYVCVCVCVCHQKIQPQPESRQLFYLVSPALGVLRKGSCIQVLKAQQPVTDSIRTYFVIE